MKLRILYLLAWLLVIILATGTVQAYSQTARALPYVDYDCNTYITFYDVAAVMGHIGNAWPLDLWAYDIDRDGKIDMLDAQIVVVEVGRDDMPRPPWCDTFKLEEPTYAVD